MTTPTQADMALASLVFAWPDSDGFIAEPELAQLIADHVATATNELREENAKLRARGEKLADAVAEAITHDEIEYYMKLREALAEYRGAQ